MVLAFGALRNQHGRFRPPVLFWWNMNSPKQKDWITGRYRQVKMPDPSELQLHISIVSYLNLMARTEVQWFHISNGELRDKRTGAKLKAMGQKPGAPDLIFRWRARWSLDCLQETLDMEIKRNGGKQSEDQKAWEARTIATGGNYYVVRSLDEAIDIFEKYGITKPRQAVGRL